MCSGTGARKESVNPIITQGLRCPVAIIYFAAMNETLLRFVIPDRHEDSGFRDGFFRTAYRLRRQHVMSSLEHEKLDELLKWFGSHLDVPERFNRSSSKGRHLRNARGISWFKHTASEHVSKAQQIVALLRKYGVNVYEIRTIRPGYVVYSDDCQIVAEPFNDLVGVK
jgi:hypothetical protein